MRGGGVGLCIRFIGIRAGFAGLEHVSFGGSKAPLEGAHPDVELLKGEGDVLEEREHALLHRRGNGR